MTARGDSLWPAFGAALALHAAGLGWLATRPPSPVPRPRPPTVMRIVSRPAPPPAPAAAPKAAEAPRPRPPPPAARPLAPPKAAPPPSAAAPAPAPTPAAQPPVQRRFAVSMSATVAGGGGLAVPTTAGATAARGDPNAPATAPVGDNTAFARGPAAPLDLTELDEPPRSPRLPSPAEVRALYPAAPLRDRIEADVRLELLVGPDGRVTGATVVRGAGQGFDEAALALARRITFTPGTRAGRPVASRVPFTWKFRLDE